MTVRCEIAEPRREISAWARRSVSQHTAGYSAILPGGCPRLSSSGTGTAADDGASPTGSLARLVPPPSRE
jgi:hypothetical protein